METKRNEKVQNTWKGTGRVVLAYRKLIGMTVRAARVVVARQAGASRTGRASRTGSFGGASRTSSLGVLRIFR